jgi:hypothetical protein
MGTIGSPFRRPDAILLVPPCRHGIGAVILNFEKWPDHFLYLIYNGIVKEAVLCERRWLTPGP